MTMRRVRAVIAARHASGSSAKPPRTVRSKRRDVGAEEPRGAGQRVVSWTLHQHVVAGLEDGGAGLKVRPGGTGCRGDAAPARHRIAGDRFDERRVSVVVSPGQRQRLARALEIVDGAGENVAAGEIESGGRPRLRPFHVGRVKSRRHASLS